MKYLFMNYSFQVYEEIYLILIFIYLLNNTNYNITDKFFSIKYSVILIFI